MGHASLLGNGNNTLLPIDAFDIEVHHGSPAHTCLNEGIYYGAVTPGAGVFPHGSVDRVNMFVSPAVSAPACKLTYIFDVMCGRFSIFTPIRELRQRFNADPPDESVTPRYNAAPGQNLIVIPMDDPHKMHLYKWGLIPHWARDEKIGYKMINARAESLKEKPSFSGSLQKGRCLVFADGFYKWSLKAAKKVPYRIELSNSKPFAMAGLSSRWKNDNGKETD
jgi:hypothetical protein